MTWTAVPVAPEDVTPQLLFDLAQKHRLIPDNIGQAVDYYKAVCADCALINVVDDDTGDEIASLIISEIRDGESAQVDFIPHPQYFTVDAPYQDKIDAAIGPLFRKLMEGRGLRRLTALVPKTRSRTFKALRSCGFRKEGVMRDAIKFRGRDAEGLVIMGMLPEKEN